MNQTYNPKGYIALLEIYYEHLLISYTISLIGCYETAKNIFILRMREKFKDDADSMEAINSIISKYEEETYIIDFYKNGMKN